MRIGIAVQAVAAVGLCLLVPSVSETPTSADQVDVRPITRSDSGFHKKLIAGGSVTAAATAVAIIGGGVLVYNRQRFLKMYRRRKLEHHETIYWSFNPELTKVVVAGTDDYPLSFNAMLGNTTDLFLPEYEVAKRAFETHEERKKSTDKEYSKSKECKFYKKVLSSQTDFTDYMALVTHHIHEARAKLQKEKALLVDSKQQAEAVKNGFKEAMSQLKYKDSESPSLRQKPLSEAYKYLLAHSDDRNKASNQDVAKANATGTAAATPAAAIPAGATPPAATPTGAGTVGAPVTTAGTQAAQPSAGTAAAGTGPATTGGVKPSSGQPVAAGTAQTGGPATKPSGTPPITSAPAKTVTPAVGPASRPVQGTAGTGIAVTA